MNGSGASVAASEEQGRGKGVTTLTATAIAVADMVGIGVFTSLGFQVAGIPSAFPILMLWIVGGLAALAGALSYAELATAIPRSGGEYVFLRRVYHPALGFLAGWVSATVGFAAPIAVAAMAFGEYFAGALPGAPALPLGLLVIWGTALVHLRGVEQGSWFHDVATGLKVVLILAFIVAGLMVSDPQPISFLPKQGDFELMMSAPFWASLVYVMYAYSGWNAATYISSEIDDPKRTLPRALLLATLIVISLYLALNAVFLYTTPLAAMAGHVNVAQIAGAHIFGEAGGRVVAGLICAGLISTISAMTWIGPRVTMAIGEDFKALRFLARRNSKGVPQVAILAQSLIATLLLLTNSFETAVSFIQFSLTLSSFMAVLGVIVLRFREPDLPRPFRVWAYPITPLVFLVVTGFMLYYVAAGRPEQALISLGILAVGLIVFVLSNRFSNIR